MEIIKIENCSFQYSSADTAALDNISFSVESGEFVTLCGSSGSGKSTLLRMMKPSISPKGIKKGSISCFGMGFEKISARDDCAKAAFVMQDPDAQFVSDKVRHELAFLCESLGMERSKMRRRISELVEFFKLGAVLDSDVAELSGGQKQLVNLASAIAAEPELLLLDEPTAMLDPVACEEFLTMLHKINKELGVAVVMATHMPNQTLAFSDRLVVMDCGRITHDGKTAEIALRLCRENNLMSAALGAAVRVCDAVCGEYAEDVSAARALLAEREINEIEIDERDIKGTEAVRLDGVYFAYEQGADVICDAALCVKSGEIAAICGGNGAGKSTLLGIISGMLKPYSGKVKIFGKDVKKIKDLYGGTLAMLVQRCERVFTQERLCDEFDTEARELAEKMGLGALMNTHPYDLSGGERQKAALCKILVKKPRILLLDEPTKGLDAPSKAEIAEIITALAKEGTAVIMVTHDLEFAADCADRCIMLSCGEIVSDARTHAFFTENRFYTTQTARICHDRVKNAVRESELFAAYGAVMQKINKIPDNACKNTLKKQDTSERQRGKPRLSMLPLLLMPAVMTFAALFGYGEYYREINVIVLLLAAVSFFIGVESKKNNAGELVLTAVLAVLSAVSRLVFAQVPQFKPALAIVVMSGLSLGCETGAAVGAMSMFLSNLYLGQSMIAPWQMLGFAAAGFISGIAGKLPFFKNRVAAAVLGFFCAMPVYAFIVNTASVMLYQPQITAAALLSSYATALVFDIIHAAATAATLILLAPSMRKKLERVKQRYNLSA